MVYAENTTLNITYETLDFKDSKKKDKGKRVGIALDYRQDKTLYQLLYEKTYTDTFQPPLSENLKVNKYYFKYTKKIDILNAYMLSYVTIDDNLMKETDNGHIYGLGYRYNDLKIAQYLSDYKHFNVYQSEASFTFRKQFGEVKTRVKVVGKYIHLQNKKSNNFSKNAKTDYFIPGIKLHALYKGYHFGAGAFFGKRIFAVMHDGLKVQHHAMEFNETYMGGLGKHFEWGSLHLKYVYQIAEEIPQHNKGVKVENIILKIGYHF
jgi:hypothetical protein